MKHPGIRLGITAEHVQKALIECSGSRKDAAILLGTNTDIVRAIIRCSRSVYKFTPPPKLKPIKLEDVYTPTPQAIREACAKFRESWGVTEERTRRTFFHSGGYAIPREYEIPTGMPFSRPP